MKKLGLIGGIGPASTIEYYRGINEGYQKLIPNPAPCGENPEMIIDSLNLSVAYDLIDRKDWNGFVKLFVYSIYTLYNAGAEIIAIAANTAHIVIDEIRDLSPLPVVSMLDETCKYAFRINAQKLIIFGTGFTMSSGMYEKKCAEFGLEAIVPNTEEKKIIHNIIFPNLVNGIVLENDKKEILRVLNNVLLRHDADTLVLACTELPLIIKPDDVYIKIIDSTKIHIEAILQQMSY